MLTLAKLSHFASQPLTPNNVEDLIGKLDGLAKWWLTNEAIEYAQKNCDSETTRWVSGSTEPLQDTLGACWVVLAVKSEFPLLKKGLILPLVWKQGETDSKNLPTSLRDLAEKVRQQVSQLKDIYNYQNAKNFGLHLGYSIDIQLADDLFKTFDSAWASLVGGLTSSVQGIRPDPTVWASVAWVDKIGVSEVESLEPKIEAAASVGATRFAVALSQLNQANTIAEPLNIEIIPLVPVLPLNVLASTQKYLSVFTQQPEPAIIGDEVSFRRCATHYQLLRGETKKQISFQESHLQHAIIDRCRQIYVRDYPNLRITHLIVIISQSPSLQHLIVETLKPDNILFFYTLKPNDPKDPVLESVNKLKQKYPNAVYVEFKNTLEDIKRVFKEEIQKFTEGIEPQNIAIDIKSGFARMKYWLATNAKLGSWIFNLEAPTLENRENVLGQEDPELWQITENEVSSPLVTTVNS